METEKLLCKQCSNVVGNMSINNVHHTDRNITNVESILQAKMCTTTETVQDTYTEVSKEYESKDYVFIDLTLRTE